MLYTLEAGDCLFCVQIKQRYNDIKNIGGYSGMICFGVDIGGTTVKLGMFSETGELLEKWEIPTRKENAGANICLLYTSPSPRDRV